MNSNPTILRSTFGRRIFLLFVACALLPVGSLAFLSYRQVAGELRTQALQRLRHTSKNAGMIILEQLEVLQAEMAVEKNTILVSHRDLGASETPLENVSLKRHLVSLSLVRPQGKRLTFFGPPPPALPLSAAQRNHLAGGKDLIMIPDGASGDAHRLFMVEAIDPLRLNRGLLVGEIDISRLWRYVTSVLSENQDLSILGPPGVVFYSSRPLSAGAIAQITNAQQRAASVQFAWGKGTEASLSSSWSIFLLPDYQADNLTVVTSEYRADAFAPANLFSSSFLQVGLLTFLVVLLLSSIYIRRNLIPLARIKEGTQRISAGDFSYPITVSSGDEFQDLALSFNRMAEHLQGQFSALSNMGQLVKKLLGALENDKIVDVLLTQMRNVVACDWVGVMLIQANCGEPGSLCWDEPAGTRHRDDVTLSEGEMQRMSEVADVLIVAGADEYRGLIAPLRRVGAATHLLLPLRTKNRLWGVIALGYRRHPNRLQEDSLRSRQVADQAAVALANARLMEELAQLNGGALLALARTVDANSSWTAGHSERVAEIAQKIGLALHLSPRELETLHRGALLHDLGKIGVPAEILDKPGKLTEEEFSAIKTHPELGARILEPITVYEDIVPLLLEHHEWFDGQGYPRGLSGEAITLGARILAVADVVDSLCSDRPYRSGWEKSRVENYLREQKGSQFDPSVVKAYFSVLAGNVSSEDNDRLGERA